ncbi:proprotein convertase subtilisin/kexin type 5-like [Xyrauchen texanus]|uniref:proprotein convertase subtilisin/kexin type 5-like n=1 Tax=Xyrauchen texanus TaxID=154827 RepID=UPI002241A1B5|nr:proprotein convertase subtilisin/kexin type 5-like [Xyrauchen texanus]
MSCLPDYYQLGSSCRKTCPEKTFADKISMRCDRCDDHCETCDASECYLCENGFFLSDGTCVETCNEGFYGDMRQECEPCHPMCRSCGGPNYDDCDSCEEEMHLDKGQCVNKSSITCPDGNFVNGQNECEMCHSSCWSCSGHKENQCNSCEKGMFLTNNQMCVSVCPHETYANQTSGHCEDCLSGCLMCQDSHYCLKCKSGFGELYLQEGKCVAECKRGYPEDGVCHSCAKECASCEGEANFCLSCEEEYLYLKHTCVLHCPSSHFIKDGVCERCPARCTECDQSGKCSSEDLRFICYRCNIGIGFRK